MLEPHIHIQRIETKHKYNHCRQASFQAGLAGDLLLLRQLCVLLEGLLPTDGADLCPLFRWAGRCLPLRPDPTGLPLLAAERHPHQ